MIGYLQSIINENIILYVYTSSLTNLVIREREGGGDPLLSSVIYVLYGKPFILDTLGF